MNYISNKTNYEQDIKNITYSNYDYMAGNTSYLDNTYSCAKCSYTIDPKIKITYSSPYNTGSCVKETEKKAIPFNIQNQPKLFTNLVDY